MPKMNQNRQGRMSSAMPSPANQSGRMGGSAGFNLGFSTGPSPTYGGNPALIGRSSPAPMPQAAPAPPQNMALSQLMQMLNQQQGGPNLGTIRPNITRGPIWSQGKVNQATRGLRRTKAPPMPRGPAMKGVGGAQQGAMAEMMQDAATAGGSAAAVDLGRQMGFGNAAHNLSTNQAYAGAEAGLANNAVNAYGSQMGNLGARRSILMSLLGQFV